MPEMRSTVLLLLGLSCLAGCATSGGDSSVDAGSSTTVATSAGTPPGSTATAPTPLANVLAGGQAPTVMQAPAGTPVLAGIAVIGTSDGYCPPVVIRPGTESLVIYDKGHDDDPNSVRYQASIGKTARECHTAGTSLMLKVGVAGRLLAGPKGTAGNFAVPIRVAVVSQGSGKVFYSQITKTPVTLTAPDYANDFSTVIDNIAFDITPDDHDLIIYVGYDEGKPKTPAAAPTG